MELSELQKNILNSPSNRSIVMSSAASGKALSNNSKVYTKNGFKMIKDIVVGDVIFGEDGLLHKVLGVFPQGKKQGYKVTFSDGTEVICCKEHLWTFQTESLRSKKSKNWITCNLQELINKYPLFISARAKNNFSTKETKRKNIFIPMTAPVEFEEQNLLIEPYTMGALLGDGSFRNSIFTNQDEDIINWVNEGLNLINCTLKHKEKYDYSINTDHKHNFCDILKKYGLWQATSETKFIPEEYKYNSVENRLKILQGLIDTDGSCCGNAYDITLKSKQLILDIQEICESLGLTAIYSEKKAYCTNSVNGPKDCGIVYRLRIKTSKNIPKLHRSKRRELQWKPTRVYSMRAIIDIQDINEEVEMTCIKVDNPTELFLTDHFIVTHNTTLMTEKVRQLLRAGVNPKEIAVITFTNMAAAELRQRLGQDYKDGLFVGTIHALANWMLLTSGIKTDKVLNNEEFDELFLMVEKNPVCIKHMEWVLLDEAQDTDEQQFKFLFDMINPDYFFIVGDIKQSIYRWRAARPDLLQNMTKRSDITVFDLNENYRNGYNILNYAKNLIRPTGLTDSSISKRVGNGSVKEIPYDLTKIINEIRSVDEYKDWAILTRTNQEILTISSYLNKSNIPYDTFKQGDLSKDELNEKMNHNTVKLLTVHSAKGLEWRNVIVVGMRYTSVEERSICYVAATRAMENLIWVNRKAVKKKPTIYDW